MGMDRRWLIAIVLLCVSPGVILGDDQGKALGPESSRLVGRLVLSSSGDSNTPPYCVVDHWGRVVGEVSPAAGIDLRAYCNRTVTLVGTMVATRKDAPPHLVATRVLGADLGFNLPVTAQAGQVPVCPVAYQEPSTEDVPPGNLQPKRDQMPSAGQKSLLSSPAQGSGLTPPPAPVPVSPPASGSPPMPVSPLTPGSAPMLVPPLAPESAPVLEPGPFPLPDQPAESVDSGEPACGGCQFCCPRRSRLWGEVDYLFWWTQGMSVPPLVTEGSAADARPGALGQPGTTVLFGGDNILTDGRSGGLAAIGYWFNDSHTSGIEFEYLGLADDSDPFQQWSSGTPVLARPFFNTQPVPASPLGPAIPYGPVAELVAYPVSGKNGPPLAGSVSVDPRTDFQAAALRMRWEWFGTGSFCDPGDCSLCQWGHRVDVTLGFRYLQLNDNLGITEELTYTSYVEPAPPTPPLPQGSVLVQDSFRTYNVFQGGEMGLVIQNGQGRWTMEVDPQIALGNTQESVAINGSTTVTSGATGIPSAPVQGGLLALGKNIGEYQRNVFAVVPQIAFKLGYQLTPRLRLTTGYDFLYWSRVARAGSQIDTKVNVTTTPGFPAPAGAPAPTFTFQDGGFWAQGLSLGMEYGW